MKKIVLILFLIASSAAFSQKTALTNEALLGKWELLDLINPKMTAEELAENKSYLEGTFLEFKSDNICVVGIIQDLDGTWTLDIANKTIVTETRRGKTVWKIHAIESDKITLSRNEAEQKIIFKRV